MDGLKPFSQFEAKPLQPLKPMGTRPPLQPLKEPLKPLTFSSRDEEIKKLHEILRQNQNKNFVQRIMKPDISPVLVGYAGPGTHGTHYMSSASVDNMHIAYPHIVQGADGNLVKLGEREALDHALKTKEYIQFKTPEEANWFGMNYKKVWGW